MRLPFDLHHPQRRASTARDGDRNAGAAFTWGGGEMRRPQPRFARGRAGVGVLGDAAAKGGSDVGRCWFAATEGPCRSGAAANGRACADAARTPRKQNRRKETAVIRPRYTESLKS